MANLGTAMSKNFQIGNAELRIGGLKDANRLQQKAHSVGLLQSANVNFAQNVAELKGGLPLQLVDSVITETTVTVSVQAYEYTRKNIRAMLNEGFKAEKVDVAVSGKLSVATGAADSFVGATSGIVDGGYASDTATTAKTVFSKISPSAASLSLVIEGCAFISGFSPDLGATYDMVAASEKTKVILGVYGKDNPENLSIVEATRAKFTTNPSAFGTVSPAGKLELVLSDDTPLLFDYADNAEVVVYTINPVGLGNSASTEYYTIDVLGKNHNTNLPQGFRFWKASIQGGMDYAFSNDSFAVTPMTFKILLPTADDFDTGKDLAHVKSLSDAGNKLGLFWNGQS